MVPKTLIAIAVLLLIGGCAATPRAVLDPAERSIPGGRDVLVAVPQGEIQAVVVSATGGQAFGLVGALIDVSISQHRANRAELDIKPVRDALIDYDFDRRALETTRTTLSRLPWLQVGKVSFSKEFTDGSLGAFLDKTDAAQVLFAEYNYSLTADFSALQVSVALTIDATHAPAGQPPASRLKLSNAAYHQEILYVVPLAHATDMPANAARWAADHGALARRGLEQALSKLSEEMCRSLAQSPAVAARLAQGANVSLGPGTTGKLIAKDAQGTLAVTPAGSWVYLAATPLG